MGTSYYCKLLLLLRSIHGASGSNTVPDVQFVFPYPPIDQLFLATVSSHMLLFSLHMLCYFSSRMLLFHCPYFFSLPSKESRRLTADGSTTGTTDHLATFAGKITWIDYSTDQAGTTDYAGTTNRTGSINQAVL